MKMPKYKICKREFNGIIEYKGRVKYGWIWKDLTIPHYNYDKVWSRFETDIKNIIIDYLNKYKNRQIEKGLLKSKETSYVPSNLFNDSNMDTKQVLVIRKDLNMRKGKIAAQASHASLAIFTNLMIFKNNTYQIILSEPMIEWLNNSFTKICVYVESEEELINIYKKAKEENIACSIITDNGTTEFNNVPTKTAVGIGPDYSEKIDKITGHLNLY